LKKQLENLKNNVSTDNSDKVLNKRIEEVEKRLEAQEKKPTSNVLNVICVTGNDNYLDLLTTRMGTFEQAIDYIKDCALSDLTGDCKLIEKIYMDETSSIYFSDKGRNNIIYYNENKELVNDNKSNLSRKLANSLQNSYLKGINFLINRNLDNHYSPNKLLEDYDLMTWNTHIYNLSDSCYQRKIINQLRIPIKI
jgi:hypothetical protein